VAVQLVYSRPETLWMKTQLVGRWALVSCRMETDNGTITYPFGEHPVGLLIFDDGGHIAWSMMRAGRPNFASPDPLGGTEREKAAAFSSYFSYNGTYAVHTDFLQITVTNSLFPNWTGTVQKRHFRLNGDQLHIETPPMNVSGHVVTVLFHFVRA
jgi:hypothetical protein